MAEVKWIKLATSIFDNRKIRQIECLPDGDSIIVVWLKLLCLAGTVNDSGMVYLTKEIPYNDQMLSAQFRTPITTIQLALKTFSQFGMIEIIDDILHISNWEKYQSVDRMSEIREYNRLAQQKSRAKKKALMASSESTESVNDKSMTSQRCHETDIDIDIDKDIDIDSKGKTSSKSKTKRFLPPTLEEVTAYCSERQNNVDPQRFVNYYESNGWCVGRNKMKDWRAAVRTWENNGYSASKNTSKATQQSPMFNAGDAELAAIRKLQKIKEGI